MPLCKCHPISPTALPILIPPDSPTPAQSPGKTREVLINKTREQLKAKTTKLDQIMEDMDGSTQSNTKSRDNPITHAIPFQNSDFTPTSKLHHDADIIAMQRKKTKLLMYHEKLGHLSFAVLRLLARAGIIPRELANVDPPTCPGCAYGKAHKLKWRHKGNKNRKKIKIATAPGQVVSMDQLISPTPGFVPVHRGTPTKQRYVGATVFVDHFSDLTYVHLMTEMNSTTTVEAKKAFERLAASHQVTIKHYHGDNGLFDTKLFWESIKSSNQTMSFCGVNAHHQNGKAERRIRDITEHARTSLLHAAHRWPKAIHASLWPAALKNYVNLRNNIPTTFVKGSKQSMDTFVDSPLSKFAGKEIKVNLEHFHPFGSPVYVLEDKLQASQSYNKWSDRSRVGIFMTHSPSHSSNVPLILNTRTAHVTPQFHCLYDDEFATCQRDPKFQSLWQYKAKVLNDISNEQQKTKLPQGFIPSLQHSQQLSQSLSSLPDNFKHPWETTEIPNDAPTLDTSTVNAPPPSDPPSQNQLSESNSGSRPITFNNTRTRSGREIVPPKRLTYTSICSNLETFSPSSKQHYIQHLLQPDVTSQSEPNSFSLVSEYIIGLTLSDPDTMYLHEALREPDRDKFIEAIEKELDDHILRKHWKVVPLQNVPKDKTCLPMVWSMKRKRNPLGEITRYKARLCAGGHKSVEFVDYWDTYSPVVSWQTVRLIFILAIANNWHIRSIDFVLAFPQAKIKTDIYLKPPNVPSQVRIRDLPTPLDRLTKVYKLIHNLYGLKDAGRTWNDHLHTGLIERGWSQSKIDKCLYIKQDLLLILYVDDACLISANKSSILQEIQSLQKDYSLTDDGDLHDYLGTRFCKQKDGSVILSQPRMLQRLFKLVNLDPNDPRVTKHDTPAVNILDNDPKATPRQQNWNYRSVVGCLSYIQAMVRPDITFAVQQCARFCNKPSLEHEQAVKRICRYLLRTQDSGLVFKPDKSRGLECFVDADWAGAWKHRSSNDPMSAHSRTGFVIMYMGCPILWKSSMQSLIALSTTEAEYIALSTALREVINVIHLLQELQKFKFYVHNNRPTIQCRTFEDNMSCIKLATDHRNHPRTKHLAIRLHHFRSHVINKTISIEHISTKNQIADLFTKPLPKSSFTTLSSKVMGWDLSS